MTTPPLPASPCVRVRLIYTQSDAADAGSRFYLSYTGSAPTVANLNTLAGDIAASWNTRIAPNVGFAFVLTEIDILDIATNSGNSGLWTGSHAGTAETNNLSSNAATNVEFQIARRYRGGKPRMYFPPGTVEQSANGGNWSSGYITQVNTTVAEFFSDIEALSIGSMGSLTHVNLSYYSGFKNVTNSSGRERAVPTYRTSALLDTITGYECKKLIGSQRRRRAATTP